MKSGSKILFAIGIAALAIGATFGPRIFAASEPMKTETPRKEQRQPGIVKLGAGASQLSSLRIIRVAEVPLPVAAPVNGRITYDENITTRISSPIPGRVIALHAEVGDRVGKNTVLLDLDSPELASAEADWRKAQADEVRKKLALQRARSLLDNEVIARKEYESADADYRQAVAETRRAGLRMKTLNATGKENGSFRLKTPIAGIVADKQVNPGLEVRPDLPNPLFVVTDISRLWVIADVPERSLGRVKPGQPVNIETDAYPNERFAATVDRVGLALDPGTRRVQVRCSVRNPDGKLKPEMFARISFLEDSDKTGVQIPNTSLIIEGVRNYVYVEKQPGVFEKRMVEVALKGGDSSFVEGISNGERVVSEGALLLNSEAASDAQ